jgi:maleate isomerase
VLRPEGIVNDRVLLGMLTPSSNTTLEPVTSQLLAGMPETSAHFGRFRVTEISLAREALRQFDDEHVLRAAELLAHARPRCIGWSGTSASWLGFESDERLCARIKDTTGIEACTSVLALNEIFRRTGIERFGLITPYLDDVQQAIVRNYRDAGFECVAERHLGIQDNFSFSEVGADVLRQMVREVATAGPQAITILCTNLRGAPLADELEQELGIPIYDSVATVVWKSLRLAGADPRRVRGWGRLFAEVA